MQRLILSLIILCAGVLSSVAQFSTTQAFASAPTKAFPLLEKNTRLDMIDYFNSGSSTASTNMLGGSSRITAITPMDMRIAMTESTTYQIAILETSSDSIIALIETIAMPALDSRISFYDRNWNKLDGKQFTAPSLRDWLNDTGKKEIEMVKTIIPFLIVSYEYDATTKTLTLTNNINDFVSVEHTEQVNSYFIPSLTYRWNGKKFSLVK